MIMKAAYNGNDTTSNGTDQPYGYVLSTLIQSTLVVSKLKGSSETLRDIGTSTYQIFRIEENTNRITKFHK